VELEIVNPELTTSIPDVGLISLPPDVVVKYTIELLNENGFFKIGAPTPVGIGMGVNPEGLRVNWNKRTKLKAGLSRLTLNWS
jgi:hypothetical protein